MRVLALDGIHADGLNLFRDAGYSVETADPIKDPAALAAKLANGLPGVENRLLLLFSHGVMTGRITPERFVALTSANPAKLFGLWPQKGLLAPGADGDVVIIDPQRTSTIRHAMLHDNADYSPYESLICQGAIRQTLSHGRVIFDNGTFTGIAGQGRFLRRQPFSTAHQAVSGTET